MRRVLTITVTATALALCGASVAGASATWTIQPTPAVTDSGLQAVSCTSAASCTAVGRVGVSAQSALAEYWNGSSWAVQPTPSPSGAADSQLYAVSCTSASSCMGVGWYDDSSGTALTLAEHWNGSSWAVQATPSPSGASISELDGVRCTSPASCTAVGWYHDSAGHDMTLAEYWNGTSWAVQATPDPSATNNALYAVSCRLAIRCTAVGYYVRPHGGEQTLAERWNGTRWAVQPTNSPAGARLSYLDGISCATTTSCTAVGATDGSGSATSVPLAEYWNGSSWAVQAVPRPGIAPYSYLAGVSCVTTANCTAAGTSMSGSLQSPTALAEHWNGTTWALQATARPAVNKTLDAVSCDRSGGCTAVGYYNATPTRQTIQALAERR